MHKTHFLGTIKRVLVMTQHLSISQQLMSRQLPAQEYFLMSFALGQGSLR